MPRQARIDAPGALHHVIVRGIERRKIFLDPSDYEALLRRCAQILPETATPCYAWALLPNHVHLLLRSGKVPLATVMRRLLTGYAVAFNRKYRRHGHLFQNRYKSILCQEEPYLLELVRYIHLNPLRSRLVVSLEELAAYPYGGHSVLLGHGQRAWQDSEYVLRLFAPTRRAARRRYLRFVQEGERQGRRPELIGGGLRRSLQGWTEAGGRRRDREGRVMADERILGEGAFVVATLRAAEEILTRRTALRRQGYNLPRLVQRVCEGWGVEKGALCSRQRTRRLAEARSVFCYWAVEELGESGTAVARMLGVTQPAVCQAVARGRKFIQEQGYRLEE